MFVGSLIALVTVRKVKDTGKSSERVNPVKLLPREKNKSFNKHIPPPDKIRYEYDTSVNDRTGHRGEAIRVGRAAVAGDTELLRDPDSEDERGGLIH